ncbi:MAG: substrate-binding domain-containing protein [Desulfobulbaceae bacterium]|nr:substrate-binding domain-containing protein [Desulfobulbaceae bacterium]
MTTDYPVIPSERSDDLHNLELAEQADLVLFMAGNQFMAMEEIITAFQQEYPEVSNIFYETLPPGLELRQIMAGGAIYRDRLISVPADVYSSVNRRAMETLAENHLIEKDGYFPYLHNRLTLMVPSGNPAGITGVEDLGLEAVRISQPDPQHEDIGHHIIDMYRQAGGDALVRRIMKEKKAAGTTLFTKVHHRETPDKIKESAVDVGPVWATETVHARQAGLAFEVVEPGRMLDQRDRVNYFICGLKNGRNPQNGRKFLEFILSPSARKIYHKHGFVSLMKR